MSVPRSPSLPGHVALVTGGSRGIGRAIAVALARAGADVAIFARDPAPFRAVGEEIESFGRRALALPCDVTDSGGVTAAVAEVRERLGEIDVLVNNAGRGETHRVLDHPEELWHRMIALNLTSVFLVTRAVLPAMIARRWGRIVNVASTAAKTGARYTAAYAAAKHGVVGLTRVLAAELAPEGITANAICPGYVDTPMTDASIANIVARTGRSDREARAVLEATSPQRRLIDPEEVAALAVFLCAETSAGINGQAINLDGGAVVG